MINTEQLKARLKERAEEHSSMTMDEVLTSDVDRSRLYEFMSSIDSIDVEGRVVVVAFDEPVPSSNVDLSSGYTFSVSVQPDGHPGKRTFSREDMPRDDLLALQQLTVIVWSIATGEAL